MIINIKEAKKLVNTYRSITIQKLNGIQRTKKYDYKFKILQDITGFRTRNKCPLCIAYNDITNCRTCIYSYSGDSNTPCVEQDTFRDIVAADTIKQLYLAINKRADFLEELIEKVEKNEKIKKL